MEKEKFTVQTRSVTLNVTGGKIDSYRRKDETKNTVRVYEGGKIGIAGSLGAVSEDAALTSAATEALSYGIQYPCSLEVIAGAERNACEIIPQAEFVSRMQHFLDRLAVECPRFAVSNKIELSGFETVYENSRGATLAASADWLSMSLLFQNKGAGNLYDCFYGSVTRAFDEDAVVFDCKKMHDAFYAPAEIEEGDYPVFFMPGDILGSMLQHFVGELYASGASLLSGRLGQRVANEALTLCDDRNPATNPSACFFDDEGQVAPGYRQPLIQNGILTNVLVSKGTASMLHLPAASTSSSAYDGVPSVGFSGFYVEPTVDSPSQLAAGRAVLLMIASGGDMTPDGHYATPVQLAYLLENGEIVGRLPELHISGSFSELLGERYLGAVSNAFFPSMHSTYMACRMKVTK